MIKKLLPVLLALFGLVGGVGAGLTLKPAPAEDAAQRETAALGEHAAAPEGEAGGKTEPADDASPAADHSAIKHLRQDGFKYRPARPVDWVVCDMVEQPARVAALMAEWVATGLTARAIFNLKLPMKKRVEALANALNDVRAVLDKKGMRYRLQAKQLYHDREEVTVFLAKTQ